MKVLMFGWEFPPFISGGLGTACRGIVDGLLNVGVDVTLVLPTVRNVSSEKGLKVVSGDSVPIEDQRVIKSLISGRRNLKILQMLQKQHANPYATAFKKSDLSRETRTKNYTGQSDEVDYHRISFEGGYGENLMEDVLNYAHVGESLGKAGDFDVIHAHDWMTFHGGLAAKWASGKPLVVHMHATEFDRNGENKNPMVYEIEKTGMENADRVIAVSQYTKNMIVQKYSIPANKIDVVHNHITQVKKISEHGRKKAFQEKLVLFMGRITMQKGPEYFIEAAHQVLQKIRNVRFVMAGNGDLMPRMITRMASLGIADRFHFTGFLRGDDVERMYSLSDLYVMSSVSEPFGLTAIESLTYGVPVIISKQSGVAEVVPDAITVDFWDVNKLARNIIEILTDNTYARELVRKSEEFIRGMSWDIAGEKIRQIYLGV